MKIIITGKPTKEKRLTSFMKKVSIYPTNHGNLSAHEIAELEGIKYQTVVNKICKGLYSDIKKKPGRHKKIKEVDIVKTTNKVSLGSWEQEQLMKNKR